MRWVAPSAVVFLFATLASREALAEVCTRPTDAGGYAGYTYEGATALSFDAKGVRVWVIGFTTSLNADLSYCTSPSSSFVANDAAQLNAAFQEIAKQVGELRVLQ